MLPASHWHLVGISLATLRCLLLPNVHFQGVAFKGRSIQHLHSLLHLFWCLICGPCNSTLVDLGKDAFTSLSRVHRIVDTFRTIPHPRQTAKKEERNYWSGHFHQNLPRPFRLEIVLFQSMLTSSGLSQNHECTGATQKKTKTCHDMSPD
jgi:hypothetical protein